MGTVLGRTRWIVAVSFMAAIAVFLVVQDRVTAAGAREYVAAQRAAASRGIPAPTIDEVMRPAVRRSIRLGALSGTGVLTAGLGIAAIISRLERRSRG